MAYPQRPIRKRTFMAQILGGALLAMLLYRAWFMSKYLRRVFLQPRLLDPRILFETPALDLMSDYAYQIALANLKGGIEKRRLPDGQEVTVLCAGVRNFREPWARDFGFASYGLLAVGELEAARKGLELFFHFQKDTGQFPVKIHSTAVLDRFIHSFFEREQPIYSPLKAKYITAHNTISLDGNCLLTIAALRYAAHTGDDAFLSLYWPNLKQAVTWLSGHAHAEDGLLHQSAFTDWADSVARTGRILYTNVLYWKALHELAQAAARLQLDDDMTFFQAKADGIKESIQSHFWRPDLGYFVTSMDHDILSSSGNTMAVAWGLASQARLTPF